MHHLSLAALGKLLLCTTVSGVLTIFTLGSSMFLMTRAFGAMQSSYDQRQDDHMKSTDQKLNDDEIERKERRTETLQVRSKDEEDIKALEKIVAAQAASVAKIDDIHDRQIRDEAYVGGALGIIGVFQFYLNNKEKALLKRDRRRKHYDDDDEDEDEE